MFNRIETKVRAWTRFVVANQHVLLSFSLIAGFVIDALTLRRVDLLLENILLLFYIGTAGASILLLHLIEDRTVDVVVIRYLRAWLPLLIQFVYGGLFSAFLIFYSRSASLWASWPFLLLILLIMIGNELLRGYQAKLTFQVSILYFAIFSFSIFSMPIILKRMDDSVFLISGIISLVLIGLYMLLLRLLRPVRFLESAWATRFSVAGIFLLINLLYFTNVIPPIPLALKDIGLHHSVVRDGNAYILLHEKRAWWNLFGRETIHIVKGSPAYVFGSVFAPTALNTEVVHVWQRHNSTKGVWEEKSRVSFPIRGGRDGGYRGYSLLPNVEEGLWRVNIETARGQLIGRLSFEAEYVAQKPPLIETIEM